MSKVTVELGSSGYRLNIGGTPTDFVDYGEPLEVEHGGKRYLAFMDLPDGAEEASEVESQLDHFVYEVTPVEDSDTAEVEEEEDEDEDDEDEDEDEGGREDADGEEEVKELKV